MDTMQMQAEIVRLRAENSEYRARLAEFERCDTTPPTCEKTDQSVGWFVLAEQIKGLSGRVDALAGRLDAVSADTNTAASIALELHRSYTQEKPARDSIANLEGAIAEFREWRGRYKETHCRDCVMGCSDDPGSVT